MIVIPMAACELLINRRDWLQGKIAEVAVPIMRREPPKGAQVYPEMGQTQYNKARLASTWAQN
jgi:hypothetical protein